MGYFWIYFLATTSLVSLGGFILTLAPDVMLVKRLKLKKTSLLVNWLLILYAIASLILLVYVFYLLKIQLDIMT